MFFSSKLLVSPVKVQLVNPNIPLEVQLLLAFYFESPIIVDIIVKVQLLLALNLLEDGRDTFACGIKFNLIWHI